MKKLYTLVRDKKEKIYFTKKELSIILSAYSMNVSNGFWKDYAIDNIHQNAIFSIYKHTNEAPFLKIEKKHIDGNLKYILQNRKKILFTTRNLHNLITFLKNLPRLVKL